MKRVSQSQGNSFAIPTCRHSTGQAGFEISLDALSYYIYCFILYAKIHPELEFQVTQIGCGLAGFKGEEVAPLFKDAPANCQFDEAWKPILGDSRKYWGTYGQLVPTSGAAPVAPATTTNDPLSLTDGTLNGSL